jgi:L-histidine N-alpha-methyltransferase
MHLTPSAPQTVNIPGVGEIRIAAGESIRTEISCKHSRESIDEMMRAAGMTVTRWETDEAGLYAILTAAAE